MNDTNLVKRREKIDYCLGAMAHAHPFTRCITKLLDSAGEGCDESYALALSIAERELGLEATTHDR